MRFVLYGVSSPYAAEALETISRLGWELAACVRNLPGTEVPGEIGEIGATVEVDELPAELLQMPFIVPLVKPQARRAATADARLHGFRALASLLDPTAVIASSAALGAGSYVNAGAVIGAGVRAGAGCSVNRRAALGHHCQLGDYVTIGPGAATGGGCRFGDGALLGVGAVVAPEVTIGPGAVVGAGAVVIRDVPGGATVVGNPARMLHDREGA